MLLQQMPEKESFTKIRVQIDFIPHVVEGQLAPVKLEMRINLIKTASWILIKNQRGEVFFSPWYKSKDKFNGDIYLNEIDSFQGYQNSKIYRQELLGKIFKDQTKSFPSWIGYFEKTSQLNKEFNQNGKKQIIEWLKSDRIADDDIFQQISNLDFKKYRGQR